MCKPTFCLNTGNRISIPKAMEKVYIIQVKLWMFPGDISFELGSTFKGFDFIINKNMTNVPKMKL